MISFLYEFVSFFLKSLSSLYASSSLGWVSPWCVSRGSTSCGGSCRRNAPSPLGINGDRGDGWELLTPVHPVLLQQSFGHPVDPIVGRLYGAVHLQCGLVVHVGQREALQGLIGSRSPEQRLDGKRGQAERAVMGREKVAEGGEASGSSLLPCNGTCPVSAERPGSVLIQQCQTVGNGLGAVSFPTVTN